MIEFKNVKKIIDNIVVLKDISFSIDENSIVSFIGEENSGKTVLTKVFASPNDIDGGSIRFNSDVSNFKISVMFDEFEKNLNMTVYEYFCFYLDCYGIYDSKDKIINDIFDKYKLSILKNANIDTLNVSVKKLINLLRLLIIKPNVLVLDNPLKLVNNNTKNLIKEILLENKNNMIIILTSNNMSEFGEICTHIGILENGEIAKFGTINSILDELDLLNRMEMRINGEITFAINILKKIKKVQNVVFDSDKIYFSISGNDNDKEDILRTLIENGVSVYSYREDIEILGQIYKSIKTFKDNKIINEEEF